jgi:hypothetical protein
MSDSRKKHIVKLHPFNKGKDTPRANKDGSVSTEVTRTIQFPDGSWANVPTLWFTDGKVAKDLGAYGDDVVSSFAHIYEQGTGEMFPRFPSVDAAVTAARIRSFQGGALRGLLSSPPPPIKPYGVK